MAKENPKERDQDLGSAEETTLEKHVDEMLDPNIPDPVPDAVPEPSAAASVPEPLPSKPPAKKISVIHHEEAPAVPTAPEVPGKKAPKEPVKIAISHADDETVKAKEELNKAVEEVNAALQSQVSDGAPELPPIEPETAESVAEAGPTPEMGSPNESADDAEDPVTEEVAEPEPEQPPEQETEPEPEAEPSAVEESEASSDTEEEPLPELYTDSKTEQAVDEIVAQESDQLLEAQEAEPVPAEPAPTQPRPQQLQPRKAKRSFFARIGSFFAGWWHSKLARWITILFILSVIAGAAALPTARYYLLNTVGVRSSASVQIVDQSTFQPLKNVQVQLAGQTGETNKDGKVTLYNLKLGPTVLTAQKTAFAPITQHITLGWGSNPLGKFNISPTGNQYVFHVTDFLSGKPIAKVEATLGQSDAQSDEKGEIRLTLDHRTDTSAQVQITADGYRQETVALDLTSSGPTAVKLVPARKEVFISKRTGTYNVYSVDLDGKNEQLVLAGTGHEQDNMVLVPSTTDEAAAFVSTRDNLHNNDGFLLSTLTMLNLGDGSKHTVAQSEQIQVVGWIGQRLVYVQIAAGASAASPSRVRLMSYDYKSQDNKQLASTNYFNDVMVVGNKIYYAPSSTYQPSGLQVAFYSMNADGTSKQTVLPQETWNAFRTSYDHIVLSVPNQWYDYTVGGGSPAKLSGQPANLTSRVYVDSPDGKHSAWVDNRDGKGALVVYDTSAKADKVVQTQEGLALPVRWINNSTIVYRIHSDQETADYAVSIDGGTPLKIVDVTNTSGVDKWYYY